MVVLTPSTVYAPGRNPPKSEIIQLLEMIGSGGAGLVVRFNKSALLATVPANESAGGWVLADSTPANNGYYYRSAGVWVKGRSFSDTFARLTVTGGTGNAVVASVAAGVDPSVILVYFMRPTTSNTGAATLSLQGVPYPVVNKDGDPLSPGDFTAGRALMMDFDGSQFGILSDADVEGYAAAAAAAAVASDASRVAAEAAAASIAGMDATSIQGRLSLTSGVPIAESDVTGATSVYYVPSSGRYLPIFDGTNYVSRTIGSQISLALNSNAAHTGYHQSGKAFDLFAIRDAGVTKLVTGPAWSSDTARGTGAGTTELEVFNGILVNKNAITARFGTSSGDTVSVPARQATYIGSFYATANGQATDSLAKRLLFNAYNRTPRAGQVADPGNSWNYSVNAFRQANGSTANQLEFFLGLAGIMVSATYTAFSVNNTASVRTIQAAIGLDSTTAPAAQSTTSILGVAQTTSTLSADYKGYPGIGRHRLTALEAGNGSDTQSWFGTNGNTTPYRPGLLGELTI
jgi:hypothetical protein